MENLLQKSITLPSKGKLYDNLESPELTLRGMTIRDEIIRLNANDNDFKPLADMLDGCIISDFSMSSYDLCLGDFQYLLFQLRALTYGDSMTITSRCPHCGSVNTVNISIDDIPLSDYSFDEIADVANIELPMSKARITLAPTTPRILDKIKSGTKRSKKKRLEENEIFLKVNNAIGSIEGAGGEFDIDDWLESLPMKDINAILQTSAKLDSMVGLNLVNDTSCEMCGLEYPTTIVVGKDFFRPKVF